MYNHKNKLHTVKMCFSKEALKQITIAGCNEQSEVNALLSATPGRGIKAQSKNKSVFLKKLRSQDSCLVVFSEALRIPLA